MVNHTAAMFIFYRRIRQAFIGTGQTRKYLLYAFGEIALVVIGILIALQVNNWNDRRKSNLNEIVLLEHIVDDLRVDSLNISQMLNRAKSKQNIHLQYYEYVIEGLSSEREFILSTDIVETVDLISQAWDNHRNTGDQLSSQQLRDGLNKYFRIYQTTQKFLDIHNSTVLNEFRIYTRSHQLINYATVFESSPVSDNIDEETFFNQVEFKKKFGESELNSIMVELFLGTQDVIEHLEILQTENLRLTHLLGGQTH